MRRLHNGMILLDGIDIVCISFSTGSMIAYGFKRYQHYRKMRLTGEDPLVTELKRKSPTVMFSEKSKPLKLPLVRGGDEIRGYSLILRNRKLAQILMAIVTARKSQKRLRLLQYCLFILNGLLTNSTGLCVAAGGSLTYVRILLIAFPSTIGGFLMGIMHANPIAGVLLPIAILFGREIEDIPNPYEKCRLLCKAAEAYHNKQLNLEMGNLNSLVEDAADALQFPIDKVPLLCTEQPLSLVERYKLKEIIRSAKARKRVQHFSEFIKKFPECNADPEAVYQEILGNVKKIPVRGL